MDIFFITTIRLLLFSFKSAFEMFFKIEKFPKSENEKGEQIVSKEETPSSLFLIFFGKCTIVLFLSSAGNKRSVINYLITNLV